MKRATSILVTLWYAFALFSPSPTFAQDNIKISGLGYLDYEYVLSSPDGDEDGENGFDYRRLYLTTDYKISDSFSGRARLEASTSSTTEQGRPAPYVKDLYVKWKNAFAEGHDLTFGVQGPPLWSVSEKFWGFRSLEKTIMDRVKVASSRDFGVKASGRLHAEGKVKYGLMLANNESVKGENDKAKRVYGQLEFYPNETITATIGADYASGDEADIMNVSGFLGYRGGGFRVAAEGFFNTFTNTEGDAERDWYGVTLLAVADISENLEAVARVDRVELDRPSGTARESWAIVGVSFSPHEDVHFMPNVVIQKFEDVDARVLGRVTLHFDF
jgi:hypothetical protein